MYFKLSDSEHQPPVTELVDSRHIYISSLITHGTNTCGGLGPVLFFHWRQLSQKGLLCPLYCLGVRSTVACCLRSSPRGPRLTETSKVVKSAHQQALWRCRGSPCLSSLSRVSKCVPVSRILPGRRGGPNGSLPTTSTRRVD